MKILIIDFIIKYNKKINIKIKQLKQINKKMEKENLKSSDTLKTISTIDTNISYISPLDNTLVTLSDNKRHIRKVSFDSNINIIEIKNLKNFNLKNSMSKEEIYYNLKTVRKKINDEKNDFEIFEFNNKSCFECNIF